MLKWLPYVAWPLVLLIFAITLFQVKQNARKLEREIASVEAEIAKRQGTIDVLKAEWSHSNRPGYLAALASRHLGYDPEDRTRIVQIRDLPMRPNSKAQVPSRVQPKPSNQRTRPSGLSPVGRPGAATTEPVGFVLPLNAQQQVGSSNIPAASGRQWSLSIPAPTLKPVPPAAFTGTVRDSLRSIRSDDPLADLINQSLGD